MTDNKEIQGMTVLRVDTDPINSTYTVSSNAGSSMNEMAFAVNVVIRALQRDGYIKTHKEFIDMVVNYCEDVQYDEVIVNDDPGITDINDVIEVTDVTE